jgi:hypothetical protein
MTREDTTNVGCELEEDVEGDDEEDDEEGGDVEEEEEEEEPFSIFCIVICFGKVVM